MWHAFPRVSDPLPQHEAAPVTDTPPQPLLAVLAIEVAPPAALVGLPFVSLTPARFADLGAALLARCRPDEVLCPLVAPRFDAAAVIERLAAVAEELNLISPAITVAVLRG